MFQLLQATTCAPSHGPGSNAPEEQRNFRLFTQKRSKNVKNFFPNSLQPSRQKVHPISKHPYLTITKHFTELSTPRLLLPRTLQRKLHFLVLTFFDVRALCLRVSFQQPYTQPPNAMPSSLLSQKLKKKRRTKNRPMWQLTSPINLETMSTAKRQYFNANQLNLLFFNKLHLVQNQIF